MSLGRQLLPSWSPAYFIIWTLKLLFWSYIFSLYQFLLRYDVAVDVVPEVRWLSEDKYKNLKVVIEIDEIVDAEKAAELELKRRRKSLGLLRIVPDRGLQVISYSCSSM